MACRSTGWAMLCSNNAQEIMDCALIAQAASLESRIPFLHFFDGFRSYMEVQKIEELSHDDMRAMVTDELVAAHRARALNPERPTIKGTSQNPDVFFASRETVNKYYLATPAIVQKAMDKLARLVDPCTESLLRPGCIGFCLVASPAVAVALLVLTREG